MALLRLTARGPVWLSPRRACFDCSQRSAGIEGSVVLGPWSGFAQLLIGYSAHACNLRGGNSVLRLGSALLCSCFTFFALVSGAPTAGANAETSQVRLCHTIAQSITKRIGISCDRARKVANRARKHHGTSFPECTGQPPKRWRGWTLVGSPVGGTGIGTTFTKGVRSFLLSGGGVC